ncbi:hypothetical protein [Chelativorans salis]|uniref:Uncharacterized protein n=1 Tax=Chelativorans salis TaxID=2978478 RepID=A0ABT2LQG8_9HYPH|nr:hypothetical protein [Chelativorans sp. EGI FJ00035]MCT7376795.1 hypothetical protein [Chelativorans sp. EGI FJ00035]
MRKIILLTSTLAMLGLGLGGASAYNASDDFGVSDQNDLPISMKRNHAGISDSGLVTSSTGASTVTLGYPAGTRIGRVNRGYNASDDFGFSSQNDLPVR